MYCNHGPYCEPDKCCCDQEKSLDIRAKSRQAANKLTKRMSKEGLIDFVIDLTVCAAISFIIYNLIT